MTAPTLTHEQVAILRAIGCDVFAYVGDPIIGSDDLSWALSNTNPQELSPQGKAALAAYDAEWVAVRREDAARAVQVGRWYQEEQEPECCETLAARQHIESINHLAAALEIK